MGVSRERFDQGVSYQEFKDSMKVNREQLEGNETSLQLSDADLKPFRDLSKPLNVVAIAADWCADVLANLPIVARLAQDSGQLNLRIFDRDSNLDLMNQYLNKGQFQSIPTFVFFDENFNELGVWIERPDSVTDRRERLRREIYAKNPEFGSPDASINEVPEAVRPRVRELTGQMRRDTKDWAEHEVVREITELVQRSKVAV